MKNELTPEEFQRLKYTDEAKKNVEKEDNPSNGIYLANVARVGDWVAYDPGNWMETKDAPLYSCDRGKFGGYESGTNKGMSVRGLNHGWRVMRVDHSNNIVTLIHAGIPEYYHHTFGYSKESIAKLNDRANIYLNSDYAESSHIVTKDEIKTFNKKGDLRNIGYEYWLATAYEIYHLWAVASNGHFYVESCRAYGFRPAVELKQNIQTTGQGEDMFENKAWQLVKKI